MILFNVTLYSKEVTGKDTLNNNIYSFKELGVVKGRFSDFNEKELAIYDRTVLQTQRKLILYGLPSVQVDRVEIQGKAYQVRNITRHPKGKASILIEEYPTR